jgi:hypothetical protein
LNPRLLTAVLLMVLPLAGCVGGGDDDPETQTTGTGTRTTTRTSTGSTNATTTTTVGPGGNGTVGNGSGDQTGNATGNATGNSTGNQTGNATGNVTWEYDNRTGTIEGLGVPLLSGSAEAEEVIDVANGTLNLTLNLTGEGDTITVSVTPPGCEEDDCVTEAEAGEDGTASLGFDDPAEGEWTVVLSISGIGELSADYELGVAQLVPAGNSTA